MSQKEQIADAILTELQKGLPLMDVHKVREELTTWLKQLPLPNNSNANSWDELIKEFPVKENEKELTEGLKIRLSLRLSTPSNNYIISIIESFVPSSREKYIIAVYAGWKKDEWAIQKQIDELYKGGFDDTIRTNHIIWIQNFTKNNLEQALNSCAIAIMGNEINEVKSTSKNEPIKNLIPENFNYPEKEKAED